MKLDETIEVMRKISEFKSNGDLKTPQISIFDTQSKDNGYWLYVRAYSGKSELFDHIEKITETRNLYVRKFEDYFGIQSR